MLQAKIELIRRLLEQAQTVEKDEEGQGGVYIGGGAIVIILIVIVFVLLNW